MERPVMKRVYTGILTFGFFLLNQIASAGLLTDTTPDTITKGITAFVEKNVWHYVCEAVRWLGGVSVQVLFKVYGWLGSRLLYIPDFSDNATYSHVSSATTVVLNLIHIMQWIGFILLVVYSCFTWAEWP